ncbi:MAG: multiheme c-type cytochrome, partial [Desulfatiglandaceae bacterium]
TGHLRGRRLFVTAGKKGWFNNGQISYRSGRTRDIFLNPAYLNDRPDYRFISPVTCSRCHGKVTRYWDQSKMAHTTSNPKVLDMYYGTDFFRRQGIGPGYRLDNPRSNGNCVLCHAPSAAASSPWSLDLKTALSSPSTEWDGISCDYCHKVRKVFQDKTKPSGMTAVLERQSASRGSSILAFGPYDDVVASPMAASYNPLYEEGRFCSTCHSHYKRVEEDKTWDHSEIYPDSEWSGFGFENHTFLPIQTTYQEWKQWQEQLSSDDPNKGKKCQDCHMSWQKEMLPYDNYIVDGMARHMWGTYRTAQNIHPHHFEGASETQLKNALAMELEGETTDRKLKVNVYITNTNGGHWVPTGEPMRSVMLLVDAFDSMGKPLKMIKGSKLPEWTGVGKAQKGNYAGLPGAVFARVLADDKGRLHVPFWQATRIISDNRIRPKSTETLEFEFGLDDPDDEPTVEARLIYRPVIRPLAKKKNWPAKDILMTSSAW